MRFRFCNGPGTLRQGLPSLLLASLRLRSILDLPNPQPVEFDRGASISMSNCSMPQRSRSPACRPPSFPTGRVSSHHPQPFVRCPQVELLSPLIGTGFALQLLLQDHANRRGWQPIVPVQPQPDEHAVHLIPAAADPSLAAIVLRTRGTLHPICLPRILPAGPSRSLTLSGRFGRLREPYPLRRVVDRPLHLRDGGDCLWLDHGPFGPPPPEPVNSFEIRSVVSSLLLFALAAGREPLWRFAHLSCPHWRCIRIGPCLLQGAVPMCL